jgi:hypothetical protein
MPRPSECSAPRRATDPTLACEIEELELSLLFVSHARKQPKLNSTHHLNFCADAASEWLRHIGYLGQVTVASLFAACIISGDVMFSSPDRIPVDCELGLTVGGVSQPSSRWRDVLTNGLPQPPPLVRQLYEPVTNRIGVEHDPLRRGPSVSRG